MKKRLDLNIEDDLLKKVEAMQVKARKNIIDLINDLGSHDIDAKADLKELYYQDKRRGVKE